jgi:hypothetical protein
MLDILTKHLEGPSKLCTVALWIDGLPEAEKEAFALIKSNSKNIKLAVLFKELDTTSQLHFKLTAFRSHLRGYCTCQKN